MTYLGMGQTRTDTPNQRQAKIDGARRRACPVCRRKNAVSKGHDGYGMAKWCRYCDWTSYISDEALASYESLRGGADG